MLRASLAGERVQGLNLQSQRVEERQRAIQTDLDKEKQPRKRNPAHTCTYGRRKCSTTHSMEEGEIKHSSRKWGTSGEVATRVLAAGSERSRGPWGGGQCTREAPHGVRVQHGAREDVAMEGSSLGAARHRSGCRTAAARGSWEAWWAGRGRKPRGTATAAVTARALRRAGGQPWDTNKPPPSL